MYLDTDPGFLMTKNLKKFKAGKLFLNIKNCNFIIPRHPQTMYKLQEKHSALKSEHPALKNMNILYFFIFVFCGSLLPSWNRITFKMWIRIQQLKLMRMHADPDPQPCAQKRGYASCPPPPRRWGGGGREPWGGLTQIWG